MAGKQRTYTAEQREIAATALSALPDKPAAERPQTTAELLQALKPQIRTAQEKGYTLDEVAELLKNNGISISLSTLKSSFKPTKKNAVKPKA
ncbi:MAG TPA: hypothetical protein PLM85_09020 [Nitrosomonas sp.]|jgi:transposase|nr:hypothetical protein [Nitrosomonas sp.]